MPYSTLPKPSRVRADQRHPAAVPDEVLAGAAGGGTEVGAEQARGIGGGDDRVRGDTWCLGGGGGREMYLFSLHSIDGEQQNTSKQHVRRNMQYQP